MYVNSIILLRAASYAVFITFLPLGYIYCLIAATLFGFFTQVQIIIAFVEMLKYLNRRRPSVILTGTSLQSSLHQLMHSLFAFSITQLLSTPDKRVKIKSYFVFFSVLASIATTNLGAWAIHRRLKDKGIILDKKK